MNVFHYCVPGKAKFNFTKPASTKIKFLIFILKKKFVKNVKRYTIIRRYFTHNIYIPKLKVIILDPKSNHVYAIAQNIIKANFYKLCRKIRLHKGYAMHKTSVPMLKVTDIGQGQVV